MDPDSLNIWTDVGGGFGLRTPAGHLWCQRGSLIQVDVRGRGHVSTEDVPPFCGRLSIVKQGPSSLHQREDVLFDLQSSGVLLDLLLGVSSPETGFVP